MQPSTPGTFTISGYPLRWAMLVFGGKRQVTIAHESGGDRTVTQVSRADANGTVVGHQTDPHEK